MNAVHFSIRNFVKQNLHALLAALFVFAAVSAVPAQIVETGVITGVVKDNSGAVVVKAHVTVRNTDTGLSSNTSTDAQGLYVSPPLNPGNYDIEVDVPGFTKVVEHVRLEVGQRATADIALAVGANAETIEVQDTGAVLETESSSVSNLRTEEAVRDLPLNGRNFNELFSLGAGVIPTTPNPSAFPIRSSAAPRGLPSTALAIRKIARLWMALATTRTITA
jgi:hypothetical protein